jgi:fucose 4-O-acetylase-like acetyltransferase
MIAILTGMRWNLSVLLIFIFFPLLFICALPLCRRKNINDNKKNVAFLLVWDKVMYIERFLVFFPCICVLQPTLVHLYQSSSLFPRPLPIAASASLRLPYLLLYSKRINHIQVFGFLPFPYPSYAQSPFRCVTHVQWYCCICFRSIIRIWERSCDFWPLSLTNFA